MIRLKEGHRIQITGGKYDGKRGTIIKLNRVRHQVEVDDHGNGWVTRTFCSRIVEVQTEQITPPRKSRLSHYQSYDPPTAPNVTEIASDTSTASISTALRLEVLMDLLATSIAGMNIEDHQIDEWTEQLHDKIIQIRHGLSPRSITG